MCFDVEMRFGTCLGWREIQRIARAPRLNTFHPDNVFIWSHPTHFTPDKELGACSVLPGRLIPRASRGPRVSPTSDLMLSGPHRRCFQLPPTFLADELKLIRQGEKLRGVLRWSRVHVYTLCSFDLFKKPLMSPQPFFCG